LPSSNEFSTKDAYSNRFVIVDRLPLNIGVTYETFHLSLKTLVAIDLLKRRDSGFAKADEEFFKMIGGMPLAPC
jgi:hypothetical protein